MSQNTASQFLPEDEMFHHNHSADVALVLDSEDEIFMDYQDNWQYLSMIGIPCIVAFGITGNILSMAVFMFTRMRSQTSSVYLTHLSLSDTGFLLCLIPAWLGWFNIDAMNKNGWCQVTVYATFVFAFLSVWTVVAFTVERYIVIYHPLKKSTMCTKHHAICILLSMDVFCCVLYGCTLWMAGVEEVNGEPTCMQLPQYKVALKIISILDTVLTLLLPSITIIVLNSAIMIKIYAFSRKTHGELMHISETRQRDTASDEDPKVLEIKESLEFQPSLNNTRSRSGSMMSSRICSTRVDRRHIYWLKTTRSLVLISTTFLILNMPSHIFRMYLFFSTLYDQTPTFSKTADIFQILAMFVYYINFACNVFLYSIFSQSFRRGFLSLLKKMQKKKITCKCQRTCEFWLIRDKFLNFFKCVRPISEEEATERRPNDVISDGIELRMMLK